MGFLKRSANLANARLLASSNRYRGVPPGPKSGRSLPRRGKDRRDQRFRPGPPTIDYILTAEVTRAPPLFAAAARAHGDKAHGDKAPTPGPFQDDRKASKLLARDRAMVAALVIAPRHAGSPA
jgi:hypothetical protein